MCYPCWLENGRAAVINQSTISAAKSINHLYTCEGGEAGGALHLVLDGWNIWDNCLAYCRDVLDGRKKRHAMSSSALMLVEKDVLERLENLSTQERCSALAMSEHFIEMPPSILEPRPKEQRSHRRPPE